MSLIAARTGISLPFLQCKTPRCRPVIWARTPNYHSLAICVRQLMKAGSRRMLGWVLLSMCNSEVNRDVQRRPFSYFFPIKDGLSRTSFPLKTTFPYSSSILFDCVQGVLTWRELPVLAGGAPCPACRSSPWRFQWWCWPHSPTQWTIEQLYKNWDFHRNVIQKRRRYWDTVVRELVYVLFNSCLDWNIYISGIFPKFYSHGFLPLIFLRYPRKYQFGKNHESVFLQDRVDRPTLMLLVGKIKVTAGISTEKQLEARQIVVQVNKGPWRAEWIVTASVKIDLETLPGRVVLRSK